MFCASEAATGIPDGGKDIESAVTSATNQKIENKQRAQCKIPARCIIEEGWEKRTKRREDPGLVECRDREGRCEQHKL